MKSEIADNVDRPYRERLAAESEGAGDGAEILDRDRITLALIVITNQEREIILAPAGAHGLDPHGGSAACKNRPDGRRRAGGRAHRIQSRGQGKPRLRPDDAHRAVVPATPEA